MKAAETDVLRFLKKQDQFHIPIYQRTYSWTAKECTQLWNDIIRTGERDDIPFHFIGSIVYVEKGLSQVSMRTPVFVIDGQQRMTTITILLAALADALGDSEPVDGFSKSKLVGYYLLNDRETGDRRYKLMLTDTDRDTLNSIIEKRPLPKDVSVRVNENYKLLKDLIDKRKDDLTIVCKGIAKLFIVDIALTRGQDNPQLIFESLNSTGLVLTQADLIRNLVLMDLETDLQDRVYTQHWRPMELAFGQENYDEHFNKFIRHYLTMKTGEIPRIRDVYEEFKNYLRSEVGVMRLVEDLQNLSGHYCAMALGAEKDPELGKVFRDLLELKSDVTYPLLLGLYQEYLSGALERNDFLHATRVIESYLFRRTICGMPSNKHNETFRLIAKNLVKGRYLESLMTQFLNLQPSRRFPNNEEFTRHLEARDLYVVRDRCLYFLRRLENHGRREIVQISSYSIEHIMPQNRNLSDDWKRSLGENWENIHDTYLHTLGNLTLTAYNSKYSDHPFPRKRDMPNGFKTSPLYLNEGLGSVDAWNESAIRKRAEKLARRACEVWPFPTSPTVAQSPSRTTTRKDEWSWTDYRWLAHSPIWPLFEKLQSAVLSLHPSVHEDPKKTKISYRAQSQFVDIVPQKKRLTLTLKIDIADISDPKKICKDVSRVGHVGTGNTLVGLDDPDDLDYVMNLVRQSLEKQLGGNTGD